MKIPPGAAVAAIIGAIVVIVVSTNQGTKRAEARQARETRENVEAIKKRHVLIGMTAAQVRQAWGEPKRIVRTMDERHTYEEWIYGRNSSTSLYFVDGVFKSGTRTDLR